VACNIPILDVGEMAGTDGSFFTMTKFYFTPTTASAITFNFVMSFSGGLMASYITSNCNAFWTYSSSLAGVTGASAGNDLYPPTLDMFIGAVIVVIITRCNSGSSANSKLMMRLARWLFMVMAASWLCVPRASCYGPIRRPSLRAMRPITPWGQFIGSIIMFGVLGFIPS